MRGTSSFSRARIGTGPPGARSYLCEDVHRGVLDLVDRPHEGHAGARDFGHGCGGTEGGQGGRT